MKVMHINCVIHVGSTGRIIDEIIDYSNKINITSEICYGVGKKQTKLLNFVIDMNKLYIEEYLCYLA